MRKFKVYVPVDLEIELTAIDEIVAADRADFVADFFIKGSEPYKLNLPGIGQLTMTIVPEAEDADDKPAVVEVFDACLTGVHGSAFCDIPADHPSQRNQPMRSVQERIDDILKAGEPTAGARLPTFGAGGPLSPADLGGTLRGDEWGTASEHYVEG